MKRAFALLPLVLAVRAFAGDAPAVTAGVASEPAHRYLIERTFPAGALDGLDAAQKARINTTNSRYSVHWLMSYANAQKTKTYCIYEAPSEQAVREAARANNIPVDSVTEVPVTLTPQ